MQKIFIVYKGDKVMAVDHNKYYAMEKALKKSSTRWTHQTIKKDFGYLEAQGYKLVEEEL